MINRVSGIRDYDFTLCVYSINEITQLETRRDDIRSIDMIT